MKNKMKNKIIRMLDNEIIANITRFFILCFPIVLWTIAFVITNNL